MTQKDLLIKVLEMLKNKRDLADGISALVQSAYIDDATIDALTTIISKAIQTAKSRSEEQVLWHSLQQLQKIKALEAKDKASDADVEDILSTID